MEFLGASDSSLCLRASALSVISSSQIHIAVKNTFTDSVSLGCQTREFM